MSMSSEDWLSDEYLGRFRDVLATDGWDDQARLEGATDDECVELVKRLEKPGLKLKFRLTLEKLRGRKIDMDGNNKQPSPSPSPPPEVKATEPEPEPVTEAPVAVVEPVADTPVETPVVVEATPAPVTPVLAPAADVVDPDLPPPATVTEEPVVTPSPSLTPAVATVVGEDDAPPPIPPDDAPTPSLGPVDDNGAAVPSLPADEGSDDDSGDSDDESTARKSANATGTSTPVTVEPQEPITIVTPSSPSSDADPDPTNLPPAIQPPVTPTPGSNGDASTPSSGGSSAVATPTTAGSGDDKGAKFKTANGAAAAAANGTPTKAPVVIAASASDPKEKRPEVKKLVIPAPGRSTTEVKKTEAGPVGMSMKDRQAAFLATAKKDVAGQTSKGAVMPKVATGGTETLRTKAEGLALVFGAQIPGGARPPPTTKKYRAVAEEEIDDNDETGDEVMLRLMLPAAADITNAPQDSGKLEKRASAKAPWKKRYCLVKDDCFFWLKNEDEPRPLGMVKLSEPGVKFKQSGDECEITTARRSYFLKAEDEDRMEQWVKKFRVGKLAVVVARTEGAISSGLAGFVKTGPPSERKSYNTGGGGDDSDDDAAAAMAMLKARDQADRQAAGIQAGTDDGSDDEGNKGAKKGGNGNGGGGDRSGANSRKNSADGKEKDTKPSEAKKADEKKDEKKAAAVANAASAKKVAEDDSSEAKQHKQLLSTGTLFLKYKRKSPKKRMIHTNKEFDSILWSDEKKKKEKGRMAISDLKSTKDGCLGAKNQANAFTVMFTTRTLELEALTPQHKTAWIAALNWLISTR